MCGVFGFASTETWSTRALKLRYMTTGFPILAIDRGMESSGIALVEKVSEPPLVWKRALGGSDFIQLAQTQRYLNDIEKYQIAMGHVRASTRGLITDSNAHPFQYDHITLVHNGHIRNSSLLKDADKAQSTVDSAMVAYSMAHNGELSTLESVEGGFVFIWWNSKNATLNIARNTERPLYLAYINKENSMYWASEDTHLLHLLRNADIDEEYGHMYPGSMIWYQYDLKDLRRPVKVPFVRSHGRLTHHQRRSNRLEETTGTGKGTPENPYAGWTDEELERWAIYGDESKIETTTQSIETPYTTSDREEIDSIRETLRNQRLKDAKQSGYPTSKKRRWRAEQELKKLGLKFEQLKTCHPLSWHLYKNQRGFGSMLCRINDMNGLIVEVINVKDADYPIFLKSNIVLIECCNVRKGSDGHIRVIGVVSKKMDERLRNIRSIEAKSRQQNIVDTQATKDAIGSIDRDHDGPGGMKVTRARFLELVTSGCANCQREISDKEHGSVLWVGTPAAPVCHNCQTPGIMESLGFPSHLKASIH